MQSLRSRPEQAAAIRSRASDRRRKGLREAFQWSYVPNLLNQRRQQEGELTDLDAAPLRGAGELDVHPPPLPVRCVASPRGGSPRSLAPRAGETTSRTVGVRWR